MNKARYALAIAGAILAAIAFVFLGKAPPESPEAAQALSDSAATLEPSSVPMRSAEEPPQADTLAEERIIPLEEQELGEEARATRRMYLAHAPLREPSVDDPDSVENKRIMQAMIASAISRKAAPEEPARRRIAGPVAPPPE